MTYPKLVSWRYNDGSGLFSSKNDKEVISLYYANDLETELALEETNIIFRQPLGYMAPGLSIKKVEGFTRRAKTHGQLLTKYRNNYPELENKYKIETPEVGDVFGNYIYSNLSYLKNWVNPLTDKYPQYIVKEKYILLSAFKDEKFVEDLINYRPCSLYGGEITDYQTKDLPNFLKALKYRTPELYSIFLNYEKVRDFDKELSPVGKKVKVKTLNSGEVKLLLKPVLEVERTVWNGKEIEILLKQDNHYNINKLSFVPEDNYIVEVVDETTINTTTEFV